MNEIVFRGGDGQLLTDSLRVAEKFGKEQKSVVRSIDNLLKSCETSENQCSAKMSLHQMFESYVEEIPQPNGGVKKAKRYLMNRDGFTLLAMGFTGQKALQFKLDYIEAFNKMEQSIKESTTLITQTQSADMLMLQQLVETVQVMSSQISQMQKEANKQKKIANTKKQTTKKQATEVEIITQSNQDAYIRPRQVKYYTAKQVSSRVGYTIRALNRLLEIEGVQKWNESINRWELTPTYNGYGLSYVVKYEPLEYGEESNEYLVWTEKGLKFIKEITDNDLPF